MAFTFPGEEPPQWLLLRLRPPPEPGPPDLQELADGPGGAVDDSPISEVPPEPIRADPKDDKAPRVLLLRPGVTIGLETEQLRIKGARRYGTRHVRLWDPNHVVPRDPGHASRRRPTVGEVDDHWYTGIRGAIVRDLIPLFREPEIRNGRVINGNALIGNPLRLMHTARRANPRGSSDSSQRDLLAVDGMSPLHHIAFKHLFKVLTRDGIGSDDDKDPYGMIRDSSSGPWHFWRGGDKRPLHDLILDSAVQEAFVRFGTGFYTRDPQKANRALLDLTTMGFSFASADGERHQPNVVKGKDPFDLEPGKVRKAPDWRQRYVELDQKASIKFIPAGGSFGDARVAHLVTPKPRVVHMESITSNGPFLATHRPKWRRGFELVKRGLDPSQIARAEGGMIFKVDVRLCDKRLPWDAAVLSARLRVAHFGESPASALLKLAMMASPRIVWADRFGERGAAFLGAYGDIRQWTGYPGNPSGIGDNTDANVEMNVVEWAVRIHSVMPDKFSTVETAIDTVVAWLSGQSKDGCTLDERGDGFRFHSPDVAFGERVKAAILAAPKKGWVYEYELADGDAFDGSFDRDDFTRSRDLLSLLDKLLDGERSAIEGRFDDEGTFHRDPERGPACPALSLLTRVGLIESEDGGAEAIEVCNKHLTPYLGNDLVGYAEEIRPLDRIQEDLPLIDQNVLNNPSEVGRYEDDQLLPSTLEKVKAMYTEEERVTLRKTVNNLSIPEPPEAWTKGR